MTISNRCAICKTPSRKRMIELAWNDGMTATDIAGVLNDTLSSATILKHLKEHTNGEAQTRTIAVQPTGTTRERVLALQEMQLNEVERQITLAKERAAQLNANIDEMRERGVEGADTMLYHDWSEFFNILHKDNQAAISSILKAQGLSDKREAKQNDLKLGLFEAMSKNGGLAPKSISGAPDLPALQSGDENEGRDD